MNLGSPAHDEIPSHPPLTKGGWGDFSTDRKWAASISVAVGMLVMAASAAAHDIPSKVPPEARAMKNPLAGDPTAVDAGGTLYATLCASCHGASGKGDGPAAAGLAHRPPDMTTALNGQTDGEVRWKITRGGGAMPSYEKTLAETDRWRLVAFLRSLGDAKDGRAR